jgi:putative ABC transport system ATP-binding protein
MSNQERKKVVEVVELYKTFNMGKLEVPVLRNINLDIEMGEFVSIMGPSGSGKSTLLYLLGGLDKPTSGEIRINGEDISKMKDKRGSQMRRRDIGFVFQFYNLIPNLNIVDNVLLPVLLDGKKQKHHMERLDDILEVVGLQDRKKHTPRELSGGQQQRVAIARALMNDPEILLADEPIGNLDSKTGEEIMQLFRKINLERGKTIIQVTHAQKAAEYGSRIIKFMDGEIIENYVIKTNASEEII